MRYDLLGAKRPQTLGIGLESFIVGLGGIQQEAATVGYYDLEDACKDRIQAPIG